VISVKEYPFKFWDPSILLELEMVDAVILVHKLTMPCRLLAKCLATI